MRTIIAPVSYLASFFYAPEPVQERRLDICVAAFCLKRDWRTELEKKCPSLREGEETLEDYLREKRYKEDGYTVVRLMNFDFSREESLAESERKYVQLLRLISNEIRLCQATLSIHQLKILLWNNVDLHQSTYFIPNGVSLDEYVSFYEYCSDSKNLDSLHDVTVNCCYADITQCPDNFIAVCKSAILDGAVITQLQLCDLLSSMNKRQGLNLQGLQLKGLDISRLLKEFDSLIDFSNKPYQSGERRICLAGTSIEGASVDISVLANLGSKLKYAHWFDEPNREFKLCYEDGLAVIEVPITVNRFLQNITERLPRLGVKTLFHDRLSVHLKNQYKDQSMVDDFGALSPGEKFLWVCHCADQYPDSPLGCIFWQVVKPFDPFKMLKNQTLKTPRR